ncbi:MAG: hypothetical protein EBR02_04795, partial [Alphaproteobacteria bacterium]|nr:hypothetical protein [Alphaproteobacteria bacterium]
RITKQASGAPLSPLMAGEGAALARLATLHSPAQWAARWQNTQEQLLLASARHLDYKQVIIAFFHSLKGDMWRVAG